MVIVEIIVRRMKTYSEIKVPVKFNDPWFEELRAYFVDIFFIYCRIYHTTNLQL